MVSSQKKVINLPRTHEKLPCKGELYRFIGQRDPLVQTNKETDRHRVTLLQGLSVFTILSLKNGYTLQILRRNVYKGVLKVVLCILHGLEVSLANLGNSQGLASAYHMLELSHTHCWSKVGRLADRQIERQTDRQIDRQIDRHPARAGGLPGKPGQQSGPSISLSYARAFSYTLLE